MTAPRVFNIVRERARARLGEFSPGQFIDPMGDRDYGDITIGTVGSGRSWSTQKRDSLAALGFDAPSAGADSTDTQLYDTLHAHNGGIHGDY